MKKIVLTLAILSSISIFAGPKEDFEKGVEQYNSGSKTEGVKLLKKVSSSSDKEYKELANLNLGKHYLIENNVNEAKRYFKILANDKNNKSMNSLEATALLVDVLMSEKNDKETLKYVEILNEKQEYSNISNVSYLVYYYNITNNTKKATEVLNKVPKDKEYVSTLNILVGDTYLQNNKITEAKNYYAKEINSGADSLKPVALIKYTDILVYEKNMDEAEKYLNYANDLTQGKDINVLVKLRDFYQIKGDVLKVYEVYKKIDKLVTDKDSSIMIKRELLFYAVNLDKTNDVKKYESELKNLGVQGIKNIIGVHYLEKNDLVNSEKYLKESLRSEKEKAVNYNLAYLYALKGDKKQALKYVNVAIKDNIAGAKELKVDIDKMQ